MLKNIFVKEKKYLHIAFVNTLHCVILPVILHIMFLLFCIMNSVGWKDAVSAHFLEKKQKNKSLIRPWRRLLYVWIVWMYFLLCLHYVSLLFYDQPLDKFNKAWLCLCWISLWKELIRLILSFYFLPFPPLHWVELTHWPNTHSHLKPTFSSQLFFRQLPTDFGSFIFMNCFPNYFM